MLTVAEELHAQSARILYIANEVVRLPHSLPDTLARLSEQLPLGLLRRFHTAETERWKGT